MVKQTRYLRDFVFPLAFVSTSGPPDFDQFVGSAFLIGNRGYALTAAHVLEAPPAAPNTKLVALFCDEQGSWSFIDLLTSEVHPRHDAGLIQLPPPNPDRPEIRWKSPFRLRNKWEGSSCKYDQWGYPQHALFDKIHPGPNDLPRPDLIYATGYVRRRVVQELGHPLRGDNFLEVSERAGQGCSGGPLYINKNRIYDVIGIYVGERRFGDGISYAYATNEECIRDWSPPNIDVTVLEESQNATP